MCLLVKEQAFERLETPILVQVLISLIRSFRTGSSRELTFKTLLGRTGVMKIYNLFNASTLGEIRKLAGRLLIEALHDCYAN